MKDILIGVGVLYCICVAVIVALSIRKHARRRESEAMRRAVERACAGRS